VTGGIDDLCLKYFVEAGAMAVRRCKKQDLKRIARATGGKRCFLVLISGWFWQNPRKNLKHKTNKNYWIDAYVICMLFTLYH
jgi:hypothetical protein